MVKMDKKETNMFEENDSVENQAWRMEDIAQSGTARPSGIARLLQRGRSASSLVYDSMAT